MRLFEKKSQKKIRYTVSKYFAVDLIYLVLNLNYPEKLMKISDFSKTYFSDFEESNYIRSNYMVIPFLYKFLTEAIRSKLTYSPKERYDNDSEWKSLFGIIFDCDIHNIIYTKAIELYYESKKKVLICRWQDLNFNADIYNILKNAKELESICIL